MNEALPSEEGVELGGGVGVSEGEIGGGIGVSEGEAVGEPVEGDAPMTTSSTSEIHLSYTI